MSLENEPSSEPLGIPNIHPGDNPEANIWFLYPTLIQMLPPGGSVCGRLTSDLPLGCLQGGLADSSEVERLDVRYKLINFGAEWIEVNSPTNPTTYSLQSLV